MKKNNLCKNFKSKIFLLSVFLLASFSSLSCSVDKFKREQKDRYNEVSAELERNKYLWEQNQLKDYEFICQQFGGGSVPFGEALIKVRHQKLVSIENTNENGYGKIDRCEKFETIEKVFEYIRENLDDEQRLDVKYDEQLGYPTEVKLTASYAVDAWNGFVIKELKNTSDDHKK